MATIDQTLMSLLNRGAANPLLDFVMPRITNLHQQALFLAAAVVFLAVVFVRGSRRAQVAALCALLAVGLSDITCARVVKKLIERDRPCHAVTSAGTRAFPSVRLVADTHCPGSRSFPSNHASNMAALAAVGWWFTQGRKRWLWLLLPIVIGYSRIYLGFHYPSDVLGGWMMGTVAGAGVLAALRPWTLRPEPMQSAEVAETDDPWKGES